MYSGGFYPYDTLEEHWAYWSRYIWINRYADAPKPVYNELFALVNHKDYFVLTTMWITVSRKQDLTRKGFSIRREITGCSSARNRAARRRGIMKT